MTAFSYQHNDRHHFSLSHPQGMTNESSSSLLYHHGQVEAFSTEPRSRNSSISNVNGDDHNRIVGGSMERKRGRHDSLLSPVKSKETKEGGSRKQKKPIEEKKKAGEEPPAGYIHVRARRGQATDSHSLAERVRREKISERMKVLQGLVPGCDKVVGKALMLDEIINYVQSLQSQIEFLSMKLACVNPMLFDFSVDYEYCLVNQKKFEEVGSMTESQPNPSSLLEATFIQPTTIDQGTVKEYEAMNMNPPPLLLQDQEPIPLSQENGSFFMQAGDQRLELLNHIMLNNMRSFE